MRGFVRQSLWGILVTLLTVGIVSAQLSDCSALLQEALSAIEDNCDRTGRNEACYGYNQVSASFTNEVPDNFFTLPSDISQVADIATIRTAGLNLENDTWGVALMNIQANLPDTLPGQSVTFILMGEVEVENGVDPEDAFQPSEGIEITITTPTGANIRSGAGLNFNVIGGAGSDETLLTDGMSEDGDWFRVAYNERVGWINRVVFDDTVDGLADLPVLSDDLVTPMQSFYLRTGVGQPECEEAPDDLLLVQGPENIEVNITANGADIRIGSTVGLHIIYIDGQPFLEVIAFSGEINFMGVRLFPGQRSRACLGDENSRGQDGNGNDLIVTCDASPAEPVENFGEEWCILEEIPANPINYGIDILCPGEIPILIEDSGSDSGASDSNVAGIDCNALSLISPLSPVNSGIQTFSWSDIEGDDLEYQLVFFDYTGAEAESFFTTDTSYTLNLGQETSTGGEFSWQVRVFTENRSVYVCASAGSPQLIRTGELNPPPPETGPGFNASLVDCQSNGLNYTAVVSWTNADSSVTIRLSDGSTSTVSGTNGTSSLSSSSAPFNDPQVSVSSDGQTFNFTCTNVFGGP